MNTGQRGIPDECLLNQILNVVWDKWIDLVTLWDCHGLDLVVKTGTEASVCLCCRLLEFIGFTDFRDQQVSFRHRKTHSLSIHQVRDFVFVWQVAFC